MTRFADWSASQDSQALLLPMSKSFLDTDPGILDIVPFLLVVIKYALFAEWNFIGRVSAGPNRWAPGCPNYVSPWNHHPSTSYPYSPVSEMPLEPVLYRW